MTLFSLSLTSDPTGRTLQNLPTALLHDASQKVPAKCLSLHVSHRILLIQAETDKTLKAAWARYEQYLDKSVCNLPMFFQVTMCMWTDGLQPKLHFSKWQTTDD